MAVHNKPTPTLYGARFKDNHYSEPYRITANTVEIRTLEDSFTVLGISYPIAIRFLIVASPEPLQQMDAAIAELKLENDETERHYLFNLRQPSDDQIKDLGYENRDALKALGLTIYATNKPIIVIKGDSPNLMIDIAYDYLQNRIIPPAEG